MTKLGSCSPRQGRRNVLKSGGTAKRVLSETAKGQGENFKSFLLKVSQESQDFSAETFLDFSRRK